LFILPYPGGKARPPQEQNSTSPKKAARVKCTSQSLRPCIFFGRRALLLLCVGRLGFVVSAAALPKHWQKMVLGLLAIAFACGSMAFVVWCVVQSARVRVFVFSGVVGKYFCILYFSYLYFLSCFSLRFLVSL
jgi:hypothetical protein